MAENPSQQLFDLWKKQTEDAGQAWLKMLGQGQTVDPQAFWRPFMDQNMAAWSKVMTQGTASPDLMAQWKQFLDQWIAAWAKVLAVGGGTPAEIDKAHTEATAITSDLIVNFVKCYHTEAAIRSSGVMNLAAPRRMASRGMPKTTHVASF